MMKKLPFCIFNIWLLFLSYTSSETIPLEKGFLGASYFGHIDNKILFLGIEMPPTNKSLFVGDGSANKTIFIPSLPRWIENTGRKARVGNNIFFASKNLDEL